MRIVIVMILVWSNFIFAFSIKKIKTLKFEEDINGIHFKVVNNNLGNNLTIILSKYNKNYKIIDNYGKIIVFDNTFKSIINKTYNKSIDNIYSYNVEDIENVEIEKFIYRIGNQLYSLDLENLKLETSELPDSATFHSLKGFINQRKINYVLKVRNNFNFYDHNFKQLPYQVNSEDYDDFNEIYFYKENMFFLTSYNDIVCYNYKTGEKWWEFSTGRHGIDLFFVEIGIMPNIIISYKTAENNNIESLYLTTLFGDIFNLDLKTGEILKEVEEFKGEDHDNNEGLITNITLIDINNDGVKDLIGPAVDYNVYCIDGDNLSIIWEYNTGYESQAPLSFFDITGDGIRDVFGANDNMKLFILNGKTGEMIKEHQLYERKVINDRIEKVQTYIILCDFDGNGKLNLITETGKNEITIFEMPEVDVERGAIIWQPAY